MEGTAGERVVVAVSKEAQHLRKTQNAVRFWSAHGFSPIAVSSSPRVWRVLTESGFPNQG